MFNDFKNKEIYKKAKELYQLIVSLLTDKIPYPLKNQISRASMSIILNFSEGYGRFHKNDKKQFYIAARASLNEVVACFDLITTHIKTDTAIETRLNIIVEELYKMLSGLINSQK